MTQTEPADHGDNLDARQAENGGVAPAAKDLIAERDGDRDARGRPTR